MTFAGDSYGGVQAAILQDRAQRNRMFADAMNTYMQGEAMRAHREAAAREYALQVAQAQHGAALQERELALRQQEALTQAARYAGQTQLGHGYLDLYNRQMQWQQDQPTAATVRSQQFGESLAMRQAATGQFDDAAHVQKIYPWMSPEQAGVLAEQSKDARAQISSDYGAAKNAASVLNRRDQLHKSLVDLGTTPGEAAPKAGWFTSDENANRYKRIADAQKEWADLSPKAAAIQTDKRMAGLVTYDPETGQYVPSIPAPRWAQNVKGGGTTTPAPQQPTQPAAPAGPALGAGFGRPLFQAMPTATGAAPAGPTPSAGTTTGTYTPRYDQALHDRVNQLIGTGLDPAIAARQALGEYQQLQQAQAAGL